MAPLTLKTPAHCRRLIAAAVFAGTMSVGLAGFRPSTTVTAAPPTADQPSAAYPQDLAWRGVSSCTAAACHNGGGPKGTKGSEYTTWLTYDQHAKAYLVLLTDRSRIIERNYRNLADAKAARPEADETCLKCHATDAKVGPSEQAESVRADGVSCEACHGAAERWLTIHYLTGFKEKSDEEKLQYGMRPTKNLLYRAKMCVECHVGSPDRDVNHDLYAAGHPPLHFECSAYMAAMPRHWSEREDKGRYPDFEARVWALGQVASAQTALDLLSRRAADASKPWPEFAEYNCYACHHELRSKSWRHKPDHYLGRLPGALPWGTWFTPMLRHAAEGAVSSSEVKGLEQLLCEIGQEMQKPLPDRGEVARRARSLTGRLNQMLADVEKARYEPVSLQRLYQAIDRERPALKEGWDGATQRFLALAALYHGLVDLDPARRDTALRDSLKATAKELAFPPGFDSPREFSPKRLESGNAR
jgi:hypothetical protein